MVTTTPTIRAFHFGTVIPPALTITVQSPATATLQLMPGVGRVTADANARTAIAIPATASSARTKSLLVETRNAAAISHTPSAQFVQLSDFMGTHLPPFEECRRTAN